MYVLRFVVDSAAPHHSIDAQDYRDSTSGALVVCRCRVAGVYRKRLVLPTLVSCRRSAACAIRAITSLSCILRVLCSA